MSVSAPVSGVMSIRTGCGLVLCTNGLSEVCRIAGSSISPARCSIKRRPRQTMSHNAPLACFHCHASHSCADNFRRLMEGLSARNCRMKTMSSAVTALPRYRHSTGICRQCARTKTGTQALVQIISMRSRVAKRELLRYPDYRQRAATAPDARAVSLPVRFRSATT
jgi:hypothetical protein